MKKFLIPGLWRGRPLCVVQPVFVFTSLFLFLLTSAFILLQHFRSSSHLTLTLTLTLTFSSSYLRCSSSRRCTSFSVVRLALTYALVWLSHLLLFLAFTLFSLYALFLFMSALLLFLLPSRCRSACLRFCSSSSAAPAALSFSPRLHSCQPPIYLRLFLQSMLLIIVPVSPSNLKLFFLSTTACLRPLCSTFQSLSPRLSSSSNRCCPWKIVDCFKTGDCSGSGWMDTPHSSTDVQMNFFFSSHFFHVIIGRENRAKIVFTHKAASS